MSKDVRQGTGEGDGPDEGTSDGSLLRRFRRGSEDAAELLYRRYAHRLSALVRARHSRNLASRVDDEDIVQSVFKSFFRGASLGVYDVPAGQELWYLLMVITLHKIRAKGVFHRAAKRDVRLTVGGDGIERRPDRSRPALDTYVLLKLLVEEALDRLPAHYKVVVELRLEGSEVTEIARATGRSKRSIERILKECREELGRTLGDEPDGAHR